MAKINKVNLEEVTEENRGEVIEKILDKCEEVGGDPARGPNFAECRSDFGEAKPIFKLHFDLQDVGNIRVVSDHKGAGKYNFHVIKDPSYVEFDDDIGKVEIFSKNGNSILQRFDISKYRNIRLG